MNNTLQFFKGSFWFAGIAYITAFASTLIMSHGAIDLALKAVLAVVVLSLTEVALSVDNAVLNAAVLKCMSEKWQKRFVTWGILFAVFVIRFFLPIAIVSLVDGVGLFEATTIAFTDPTRFEEIMTSTHLSIMSFGGIFLLLVMLNYFLDSDKDAHWLPVEKYFALFDNKTKYAFMVVISLVALYLIAQVAPNSVVLAGFWGLGTYVILLIIKGVIGGGDITVAAAKNGLIGFMYLEVLDASFSFDGVVAAFALTNIFWEITLGLAVGSWFVRTTTLYLVKYDTLAEYKFLEPAAYWSIAFLAATMLGSIFGLHLSETIIGVVSIGIIALGVYCSILHNKHQLKTA